MNEVGLAQSSTNEMIAQVVQMLQQGATPEQLLQMGVPKQLIMQAMDMLKGGTPVPNNPLPQEAEGMRGMSMPNTLNNL